MTKITVEKGGVREIGLCPCCRKSSRCVWGFVYEAGTPSAAYYVRWTVGHLANPGADIALVLGRWGDGTDASDRYAVNLIYRITDTGPGLMVVDAATDSQDFQALAEVALKRHQVIGTPVAGRSFYLCDAIVLLDDRLSEFG